MTTRIRLADLTTVELAAMLAEGPLVALVPVGSVEPHGPHLPLSTDTRISEAASERAVERLAASGVRALIAPSVPYGVTHFAAGFAGAVSSDGEALVAYLRFVATALLATGFAQVCLVNNHLEPEHDEALRAAIGARMSYACPLKRRWARTLSAEFKSGACHAGEYETSLVLAIAPELVDREAARALPELRTSLSDGIKAGKTSFRQMGLDRAYTGAPARATADEGEAMLDLLAEMIATEVREGLLVGGDPERAPRA